MTSGTGTFTTGTGAVSLNGDVTVAAGKKLVLGTSTSSLGTTNGTMYYDTVLDKFRCYENGAWADCIGGAAGMGIGGTVLSGTTGSVLYVADSSGPVRGGQRQLLLGCQHPPPGHRHHQPVRRPFGRFRLGLHGRLVR